MNAFVLAGDQKNDGQNQNKAFLLLEGRPLLLYVLRAIDGVEGVDKIYIVGPQSQIMNVIEAALPEVPFHKTLKVIEQRGGLLENVLYAYNDALADLKKEGNTESDPPALFMSADIPLVTSSEIQQFIQDADMTAYDYCLGITPASVLSQFYPKRGRPGIKMAYLYLKEKICRMNNLHLVRPYRIGAMGYIQNMYDHRHQRSIINRLKISKVVFQSACGMKGIVVYLLAQVATLLARIGLPSLALPCRAFLSTRGVERQVSSLLKTRFRFVETTRGGSALDIDDETTYQVMRTVFREWRVRLSLEERPGEGRSSPSVCHLGAGSCP